MPALSETQDEPLAGGVQSENAAHERVHPHAKREFVALGVALAAVTLFVAIGGTVLPQLLGAWRGLTDAPDQVLASAMLLNIAIILIGWRRYKSLSSELKDRIRSETEARNEARIDSLTGCHIAAAWRLQ